MSDFHGREKPIQINKDTPQMRESEISGVPPHLDGMGDHFLDPSDRRSDVWGPGRFVEAPGYGLNCAGEMLIDGHPDVDELHVGEGALREECRAVGLGVNRVTVFVC